MAVISVEVGATASLFYSTLFIIHSRKGKKKKKKMGEEMFRILLVIGRR